MAHQIPWWGKSGDSFNGALHESRECGRELPPESGGDAKPDSQRPTGAAGGPQTNRYDFAKELPSTARAETPWHPPS
jgi:hypothetical protein